MWIPVAKLAELKPGTARVVRAGGVDFALIYTSDGLFAMDNTCPHSGGSLGEGIVEGNTVTCPLHSWQFDCQTGKCLTEKRANQRQYPVKIEKDQILVELPDSVAMPATEPAAPESEWIAVAKVADLSPGTVRKVRAGTNTIAILCSAEGIYAIENSCAHEGGPLAEGSVDGRTLTCPLHGFKFDCKTGRCLTETRYRQRTFETKIEQGKAWVRVISSATPAQAHPDPSAKRSPVEIWKSAKHGFDVWPDLLRYAQEGTPMSKIDEADLERMKWYGYLYRKNNDNNHYMCRIRVPGSELTADQARAIAFISYESGYSLIDVTTRCNMQIQGLTIEKLPGVRSALEKVGLTSRQSAHDNVRNITSHPFSGIDPDELIDTRELARQIQAMIIGNREFSDLPRKFNIALTGRQDAAPHAWMQDLSFVGTRGPDGAAGFHLLLGGNQGQSPHMAWHVPVFVRPEQGLGVTAATLRTFRELGYRHNRNQVRFRYLIERIGPDTVLLEIEKRLGYQLEPFPKPMSKPQKEQFIGWFKQKQEDLWAVGVCVPVGRLTWDQLEGLALIARKYGSGKLRTTYDQNILMIDIPSGAKLAVGYAIAKYGLSFEPDPAMRSIVACTGKQFCNIAVTETKGYAYQLIEELRRRNVQLHNIDIHMSGCPSACAMTYTGDIGLKGVKIRRRLRVIDAFDVYLGGGLANEVEMGILYQKGVPFDQLPEFLEKIIRDFYLRREEMETFSQYWRNKLTGHNAEPLKQELPSWRCSRCHHMHVGEDPPPFCPVCAALRAKFEPAPEETEDSTPPRDTAPKVEPATKVDAVSPEAASSLNWTCSSCGLKHAGQEAPELCPVCGAKKADFRRLGSPGSVATAPLGKPSGKRILIVGGSIAGHTAAHTARSLDPAAQITIISDERYSFYNRLNLTRFLSGEVQLAELFDYPPAWYDEKQIEVLTERRIISLDPIKKTTLLDEGRELPYDACILAHGSRANTPSFYRAELAGVYLLRTLDDVERIISYTCQGTRIAVVGGGVLGLEAAYGLVKRGASVKVFEYLPYLMPRQLDKTGAEILGDQVRALGIESVVGVEVKELLGTERVEGLMLGDGRRFDADIVIVSTGIKPNIEWVKQSGIHCSRGVLVDDSMQTSAEDVYAVGDVAEWQGQVVGLWTNAIEQAKVAATNAVGKMALFQGFLPVTILKCLGIPLVSIGEIEEDGDGIASSVSYDEAAGIYRRIILRDGVPIGGILLGTSSGMGDLRKLIESGAELDRMKRKIIAREEGRGAIAYS